LPEWDQWGEDLVSGLKLFVALLVWSIPILIFSVPTGIGGALTDSNADSSQFFGSILLICGSCLAMLYGLFLAIMTPGISIAYARDEQISSGLQFRDIWAWTQDNLGQVIIVAVIVLVASFVINLAGLIVGALLCLVGLIVTLPLATLVTYLYTYHLYGQLAYAYPLGGTPVEPPAPITPAGEMAPGIAPVAPADEPPVTTTGEYPGSGIEEPPPSDEPPVPPAPPAPPV
jgi:uncharacterized membrane protein